MVVTIIKIVFAVVFCLLLGCVIIYLLYRWKPDSLKKMAVLLHALLNNAPSNCTGSHKGTADESIAETSELSIDLNTREEFSCPNSKIDSLVASIRQLEILIKEHDAHLNKQVSTIAASIQLLDKKLSGGMLFAMQTASSKMRVPTAANERYPQIFYAGILDENNIGFPLESLTLDDAGKLHNKIPVRHHIVLYPLNLSENKCLHVLILALNLDVITETANYFHRQKFKMLKTVNLPCKVTYGLLHKK